MASALAPTRRARLITSGLRRVAADIWAKSSAIMKRVGVETGDFSASVSLVDAGPRGLRSGDALHLAIAMRAGLPLATLDRDLADAAEASGVEVALRPPA